MNISTLTPINPQAADLFNKYVAPFERVLLLGAGGWFGKTAIAMLADEWFAEKDFSFVGQTARTEPVNNHAVQIETWSDSILIHRQPDLVIDFAFLTKNHAKVLGVKKYNEMNEEISARLLKIASFDSVRCVLSASSGAVMQSRTNQSLGSIHVAYGNQKKVNEANLHKISEWRGVVTSIARAWSVTGGFVRLPKIYAFSEMIRSVQTRNTITVNSNHPVFRRFCALEDFLALSMAETGRNKFTVVESGGPLIEVRELARVIAAQIGDPSTRIDAPAQDSSEGDHYYSDGQSWSDTARKHSFMPLSLEEQIQNVSEAFKNRLENPPIS